MVMELLAFSGTRHLAKYFQHICFCVQMIDTGHLVTPGGILRASLLHVLDIYVVGGAYVCAPNRWSIVYDRSPYRLVCH